MQAGLISDAAASGWMRDGRDRFSAAHSEKNEHAKFNVRAIVDDLYYPAVRGIGRPSLTGKLRTRRLK